MVSYEKTRRGNISSLYSLMTEVVCPYKHNEKELNTFLLLLVL